MISSANASRLTVDVGGADFNVLALSGHESFNRPFVFTVEVLAPITESLLSLLDKDARIRMRSPDGIVRQINGIVSAVRHQWQLPDRQQLWQLEVSSILTRLQLHSDSRLILGCTLPEIIDETLGRNGVAASTIRSHWRLAKPERPTTLQAAESDYGFLARLCSRAGIMFWSDAHEHDEIISFTDTSSFCRLLVREPLTYRADSGLEKVMSANDILKITIGAKLFSDSYEVYDACEQVPERPPSAERQLPIAGNRQKTTRSATFGSGVSSIEEAEDEALLRAQAGAASSSYILLTSHAVDLRPGSIVPIEAENFHKGISGDYLITEVHHTARQYAGLGLGGVEDSPYVNTVTLIKRGLNYRVTPEPVPPLPFTFSARIESRDSTANLDDGGRTRFRQYNDSEIKGFSENSIPVRRLQPYGGPGHGHHQPGWHMPLHDSAEILVSCLNNDPDRPMIVGSLPNPETPSPVTAKNSHQNRLRTAADHEFCLDDKKGAPVITMRTFAGHNMLHLDAALAEHRIRLASDQGLAEFYAKKTLNTTSGDSLTETVGNDRLQVVEDAHRTETKTAEIHHQAATDAMLRAAGNIALEAGENIELESGKEYVIDITGQTTINVEGQSAAIEIDSGMMTIQADGGILIEGDGGGDIFFGQNGAGIKMDPRGNITLFGNEVTFDTPGGVGLFGKVNIDICDPPHVAMPGGVAADKVIGINELVAAEKKLSEEPLLKTMHINLHDIFANNEEISGAKTRFDGRPYQIESDNGEVYEGTVENGSIIIEEFDMRRGFTLLIDDILFVQQPEDGGER